MHFTAKMYLTVTSNLNLEISIFLALLPPLGGPQTTNHIYPITNFYRNMLTHNKVQTKNASHSGFHFDPDVLK